MRIREKTELVFKDLCHLIPGGVNSPVRACKAVGQTPLVASSASQDMIYDVDGHGYIDFCMSWGPLIHGHAHPEILKRIYARMQKGTTFGVTSEVEAQLAKKVTELMPSLEKIRFVSSGTEATMSAIRLARGFTGRDLIVKFVGHYHGHADFLLVKAGSGAFHLNASSSKGIPDDFVRYTICLPFNDENAFSQIFNDQSIASRIACVILEPIAGNMGCVHPTPSFLNLLVEKTKKAGTLLIFDEVMTGFRVAKGGAQELFGVKPDLTCLGKIVGGGMPAAAFGGRREIMDTLAPLGPVYQAGTLSGNPLAMEAGLATLELLDQPNFYEDLQKKTDQFLKPIEAYIEEKNLNACIQSAGSMFTLFFGKKKVENMTDAQGLDFELFGKFFRTLFNQGIYLPPLQQEAWFLSTAHTDEHLVYTQDKILVFLKEHS